MNQFLRNNKKNIPSKFQSFSIWQKQDIISTRLCRKCTNIYYDPVASLVCTFAVWRKRGKGHDTAHRLVYWSTRRSHTFPRKSADHYPLMYTKHEYQPYQHISCVGIYKRTLCIIAYEKMPKDAIPTCHAFPFLPAHNYCTVLRVSWDRKIILIFLGGMLERLDGLSLGKCVLICK